MIKLRLPLIIFSVCGWLLLGAVKADASQPVAFFNAFSAAASLEILDGLDPRDANNQPITTEKSKESLTEIFRSGLFNLLTAGELYTFAGVLSELQKALNPFSGSMARKLPAALKGLLEVFFPTVKQFQKILLCLSGLFGFCLVVLKISVAPHCWGMPQIRLSTVVLRC